MLINELHDIIKGGENFYTEFKEDIVNPNRLEKELVAFVNSNGGTSKRIASRDELLGFLKEMELCIMIFQMS